MYSILKMKKMNGLKISTLILLSLNKFETMFGMEKQKKEVNIDDEYVNKNYYLIDALGNKITLNNDKEIKFSICSQKDLTEMKNKIRKNDVLLIAEENKNKILVHIMLDNKNKLKKMSPILYKDERAIICKIGDKDALVLHRFTENEEREYENKFINCNIVEKIGEDSINDDYCLVDDKNNQIEKIKNKNIVFKLLTRKKYLELQKKLKNPVNYLKNDEEEYILDKEMKPLFFEEKKNNLILYVKRLDKDFCLACLNPVDARSNFSTDKTKYVAIRKAKKGVSIKREEKKEEDEDDSSKCCCGIY